jgi:hypothetical protein
MKTIKLNNSEKTVKVDDEDYPVLSRLNWYISDGGYAITDSPVKHIKMHKLIIGPVPSRCVIDHINRNKLDNRKTNLRVVSCRENLINTNRIDNARHFYYDTRRNVWVIDSKSLGVRYVKVPNPEIAERVVKRLRLGFPKQLALSEALTPTISISNWSTCDITYKDYLEAKEKNMTIKNVRRKSKRGPAKEKK